MTSATDGTGGPERLGSYRLMSILGQGGMGVVHLGLDRAGRAVAIKVLRPHVAADPEARARLGREVASLRRIAHPRVAAVVDADLEGPRPFLVTRFVDGEALDTFVDARGPLARAELARLGLGLADALHAIHAAGVVHRDLKPGNVLLVDGNPVVIDFGIAHVTDDIRLTMTGLVMGTPGYLAPEVLEGAPVGRSTDWWGWAATMTYAATGRPPFGRGPMEAVLERVRSGRPDLEGADPLLRPLLAACLSAAPAARPDEATLRAALEDYAAGRPAVAAPTVAMPAGQASAHAAGAVGVAGAPGAAAGGRERGASFPAQPIAAGSSQQRAPVAAPTMVQPVASTRVMPTPAVAARSVGGMHRAPPAANPVVAPADSSAGPASLSPAGQGGGTPPAAGARRRLPWERSASPGRAATPERAGAPAGWAAQGPLPVANGPRAQGPVSPAPVAQAPVAQATLHGDPSQDPRLFLSRRSQLLGGVLALLVALASVWPVIAIMVAVSWAWLARTTDRAVTARVIRRHEFGGARRSDTPVAIISSPLHLLQAALSTLLAIIAPLLVAAATALLVAGISTVLGPREFAPDSAIPVALGALAGVATAWWGFGGVSLRRGSRSLARAMTPGRGSATELVTSVLFVAAVALAVWMGLRHGVTDWTPFTRGPWSDKPQWQW